MTKLGYRTTAEEALQGADLTGKVAVVTGGNSGIGVETVRALAGAGCDVVLCSRSVAAGEKTADEIKAGGIKGKVTVKQLDLSDLKNVKRCANELNAELPRLDYLILNAGVMACPYTKTKDGFEMQIGTNHIGHHYLTTNLLPKLQAQTHPSRVVCVSSSAHGKPFLFGSLDLEDLNYEHGRKYNPWQAYGESKLANVLFTRELARRMAGAGAPVKAFSLHPGIIRTPLLRHSLFMKIATAPFNPLLKTAQQGAATTVVAALSPGLEAHSGAYLADCKIAETNKEGKDMAVAKALWDKTEELISGATTA